MGKFIQHLQNQPYGKRVRYLWIGTIIAGVIVVIAWGSLTALNLRSQEREQKNDSVFQDLQEDLQTAREEFSLAREELQLQLSQLEIPTEENRQLLTLDGTTISEDKTKLTVEFSIENPTLDVLNVFQNSHANAILTDGSSRSSPEEVLTRDREDPYPVKILSKQTVAGIMVFPAPQNSNVTLDIENMFFESIPGETFTESLTIDTNSDVKGVIIKPLPRQ